MQFGGISMAVFLLFCFKFGACGINDKKNIAVNEDYIEILFTDVYFQMLNDERRKVAPPSNRLSAKIISHAKTDTLFLLTQARSGNKEGKSGVFTKLDSDTIEINVYHSKTSFILYPLDTIEPYQFAYRLNISTRRIYNNQSEYPTYDYSEEVLGKLTASPIEYFLDTLEYQKRGFPVPKVICKKSPSLNVYFQDSNFSKYDH